ncbi:MAG: Blue-light-activated protein [Deltaproteobacteria bacterium ADurb.Bin510]|nr:MAG: Blue-light-activated protein [Deltaproteobacteria bacterium ADurb.Bin510]
MLLYDAGFPPIEFEAGGRFVGLGADVIDEVEKILGVRFIKRPNRDWTRVLPALASGRCAVAPTIVRTAEREKHVFFTTPYATSPIVIITRQDRSGRLSLADLAGRRLGVVAGYASENYLRDQALINRFEVVPVANVAEGLERVSFGEIDAFVESLAAAAYYIDKHSIPNLRVAGQTDYSFEFSVGISRRYPLLFSSVQKALNAIPAEKLAQDRQRWITLKVESGLDPQTRLAIKLSAIFGLILILSLSASSVVLKRRLNARVSDLRQSEARYRRLAENAPAVVYQFRLSPEDELSFSYVSEAVRRLTGLGPDAIMRDASLLSAQVPDSELRRLYAELRSAVLSGRPHQADFSFQRAGQTIWVEAFTTPERQADGSLLCDGFLMDVSERMQAQAALRETEARFLEVYRCSSDAILLIDGERFVDCNDAALRLLGYAAREDVLNRHPAELSPPTQPDGCDSYEKARHMMSQAREKGSLHFEWMHRKADGSELPVEISLTPIVHAGRNLIYCVWYDISERRRLERELKLQQNRFESLVRSFPGTVYQCRNDESWTMLYMSREIDSITGYPTSDFIDNRVRSYESVIHPADREPVRRAVAAALEGHQFWKVEYRVLHSNGSQRWVHEEGWGVAAADGSLDHLDGYLFDVTDRKLAEEALVTSEAKLRALFGAMQDVILVLDRQGRYIEIGPTATNLLYRPAAELLGKTIHEVLPPNLTSLCLGYIAEVLAQGSSRLLDYCLEIGGRPVWFAASISPFTPESVLWVARDITERREAEQESEKLRAQLAQAQKMESVGRLAGGVAHDFNNMLGVIIGHTELALDQLEDGHPVAVDLQEIRKAAQRSADLTRQLLAFARKQTVMPKVLDINATVEGMLKMLRRLIGEDIVLNWQPGAGLEPLLMDPSQVDQILANLCVNARDAIAGRGTITISTTKANFDAAACAASPDHLPGDFIVLAVSDDGCGMPPAVLEKLFEPFFTTKEIGKGTGLGLATVYGIVKQNRGFITVASAPAQGTTFNIHLPLPSKQPEQSAVDAHPCFPDQGHETILLVEDEAAILNMTKQMLTSLGYKVLATASPEEAQRLAREHRGRIDLLITDVIMPGINGRELARGIQTDQPGLRHLFMSGYTANVIAQHGVLDAGENFIQKPFSLQELASKVRQTLEG